MNEDRRAKLKALKEKKANKLVTSNGQPFIDALETKLKELGKTLDAGVDINSIDTLLAELAQVGSIKSHVDALTRAIGELKIPDMPDSVELKDLPVLVQTLKKLPTSIEAKIDLNPITLITDKVGDLIGAVEALIVPKQGQKPEDYVPMRRVLKVGEKLLYDDSFYTGGGSGGSSDFRDQVGNPTTVKLTTDGAVPVDIQDASIVVAGVTNDGTFATPARQDTGNTSLASIKTDLDEIALDTDNLATIKTNTDKIPASPAQESGNLLSIKTDLDEIATDTDKLDVNLSTRALESGGNLATIAAKDFATQTTLALIKAKTDNLDVATSTRTKPADQQHVLLDANTGVDIGKLTANQSINNAQVNGATVNVGIGTASTGTQRVAVSSDSFPATQPISAAALPQPTPPTAVSNGQKLIAVTNTAVAVASSTSINGVIVQALDTNGADIYVGSSAVTTATGFQLQPGQATSVAIDNLSKVFINGTSGDGCCFIGS